MLLHRTLPPIVVVAEPLGINEVIPQTFGLIFTSKMNNL